MSTAKAASKAESSEELTFKDYFASIFTQPEHSDFTVVCPPEGDATTPTVFYVNKAILCRVEWFRKACLGHFAESRTKTIELPETTPAAVELLLTYIYGFDTDVDGLRDPNAIDWSLLVEVFILADRLKMPKFVSLLHKCFVERTENFLLRSTEFDDLKGWQADESVFDYHSPDFAVLQSALGSVLADIDSNPALKNYPEILKERHLQQPDFSDLTITCPSDNDNEPNTCFHVHKAIVCRIDWFRKACSAPSAKNRNNTIHFPDDDAFTIEVVLKHIYVFPLLQTCKGADDEYGWTPDLLVDVYMLADKLNIPTLLGHLEWCFTTRCLKKWRSKDPYNMDIWDAIARVFEPDSANFVRLQLRIKSSMSFVRGELLRDPKVLQKRLLSCPLLVSTLAVEALE